MPRFDREVIDGRTVRHGQESMVSAIGVAQFGYFNPMRLEPSMIERSTKWKCLAREVIPDWRVVCEVAAKDVMSVEDLMQEIAAMLPLLHDLPMIARTCGVPEEVIQRALTRAPEITETVAALER